MWAVHAADIGSRMAGGGFTAQELRDLEFVYKIYDVSGCGIIENEELRKALRLLGFKVNGKTVHQLLQGLGTSTRAKASSTNAVDFEGFLEIVTKLQGASFDQHEEINDVMLHIMSRTYIIYYIEYVCLSRREIWCPRSEGEVLIMSHNYFPIERALTSLLALD
jgi:hypothetical protein